MTPNELLERIIYRDAMMLVLNKPAGVAVHPGAGKKQNLQDFFEHLKFGLPNPPALAHRLDAATSGCLVTLEASKENLKSDHGLSSAGYKGWVDLVRAKASHRSHSSTSCALPSHGLAHCRGYDLRRTTFRL